MTSNKIRNSVFLILFSLILFWNCAAPQKPTGHLFAYLEDYGAEYEGFAIYTYVLTGSVNSEDPVTQKYNELVETIVNSTAHYDTSSQYLDESKYNLFVIPAEWDSTYKADLRLSQELLLAFSSQNRDLFSNPGPYLITIDKPIRFGYESDTTDMLIADLTYLQPAAIPELVREYKSNLVNQDLDGIEKLRSLRINILNGALIVEENLKFAKIAFTAFKNLFHND